ncbi:MAG: phage tail protein [Proteobacteria bacterium]|nr:phage tail protein [Pseudomonadota bacterium]
MSESIGEMILPGTYIDVRAEGLIGVGGIAVGNVGVVGTANRGPLNKIEVLGSHGEAKDMFGDYDAWPDKSADQPGALTLTRTMEQLFAGGASTVYAVRVANIAGDMASTTWAVTFDDGGSPSTLFELVANSPGTWGNDIEIELTTSGGEPAIISITHGRIKEKFEGDDAEALIEAIDGASQLVKTANPAVTLTTKPDAVGDPTDVATNGNPATSTEAEEGLALLENHPVNIVVVGGMDAKTVAAKVLTHLENTENDGRERIAILGASSDDTATLIADDVGAGSNPRLVLVAPGIVSDDATAKKRVNLPGPYAAAVVAGKLSTLAPETSLTNKDLPVAGLSTEYTRAKQKQLLLNRVLVLHKNLGIRVLKGISTDTGAFKQISVRRIVDYAKAGVRIGSNPYIGKLNNARVRGALKATLDGFLSSMILDEMLTGYALDVSATRAQEIAGQAIVTMTLQPTFSIDYVKVIMNLE